jgi:hypothetical protein
MPVNVTRGERGAGIGVLCDVPRVQMVLPCHDKELSAWLQRSAVRQKLKLSHLVSS